MICAFFCGMPGFKRNGQERKSTMVHQLWAIAFTGLPFLIIIVCHILIYAKIRQSRHELTTYGSIMSRRNDIRYFRMTLLVVGFIICSSMGLFFADMLTSAQDAGEHSLFKINLSPEFNKKGGWLNFVLYVNGFMPFWINPFVYVGSNKSYRREYFKFFREHFKQSRMSYTISTVKF